MEGERQAVEIDFEVDFGREAATRAAERLIILPPLAPAAETWARTTVESNIAIRCAVSLIAASASKKASKLPGAGAAQPPASLDSVAFDPFSFQQDSLAASEVDVGRGGIIE